jgi:hypothetical protein
MIKWIATLAVGTFLIGGCKNGTDVLDTLTGKTPAPPLGVLILVDYSGSAKEFMGEYQIACSKLVRSLPPNSRLVASKISGLTEATFVPMLNDTTPPEPGVLTEPIEAESLKVRFNRSIDTKVNALFSGSNYSSSTDILSSLSIMKGLFPQDSSFRQVLVIFSDMIHETRELNLDRRKLNSSEIPELVAQLKADGHIPHLPRSSVYVIGAYSSDQEKYRTIRSFWEAVFKEAGMDLRNYGHSVTQFDWR